MDCFGTYMTEVFFLRWSNNPLFSEVKMKVYGHLKLFVHLMLMLIIFCTFSRRADMFLSLLFA